ncbi:MAG: putative toxin-antitoxin system toxin component, PIN family, partial [Chloroflexi bacterium]
MKVVINTNILVSALINPFGPPARVIDLVLLKELKPVFDDRILAEYREVLRREKFNFNPEDIDALLAFFEAEGEKVIAPPLDVSLPDPDDRPFLEVAV